MIGARHCNFQLLMLGLGLIRSGSHMALPMGRRTRSRIMYIG